MTKGPAGAGPAARGRIIGRGRNGGRGTTLSQIAQEAGVTTAGLLHHFESKEQLLHAVLDARDADDLAHVDMTGDVVEQLERVIGRFERSPDLIGLFTVLLTENLNPDAPLHDRFLGRYRDAVTIVTEGIRRGQNAGRYRTTLIRPSRPWRSSPFSMEWRLHGCSIHRFR